MRIPRNISTGLNQIARVDSEVFAARVLKDEATGKPITLAQHHVALHRMWNQFRRSVCIGFIGSGKSQQLCAWIAWKIGNHPELRFQLVHNALTGAEKDVAVIMRIIESSEYKAIFPHIRPGEPWSASVGISVVNRPYAAKEANVTPAALGQGGSLGGRFDVIALDDPDDIESTRTPDGRDAALAAFNSVHFGRLEPAGQLIGVGNAWHPDDLLHTLKRAPGCESLVIPVEVEGVPTWPQRWPKALIEQRKADLGARAFQRMLMSQPLSDAALAFSPGAIQRAVNRGTNDPNYAGKPDGRIVVCCDPAFGGEDSKGDFTGIVVICDRQGHRWILEAMRGRWSQDNILGLLISKAQFYKASIAIEKNGGGQWLYEQARKKAPSFTYNTNADTRAARIDWMASELLADRWSFRRSQRGMYLDDGSQTLARNLALTSAEDHLPDDVSALLVGLEHLRTRTGGKAQVTTINWLRR